ncbi:MAG: acyl-CoA dehydrogenase family protein [Reyranella sp.]|uniref:acyl-CoA dehydrogenase family protein n=1 Tax=Reyranella sp. TaxID=1929291 RepID=UPI001AC13D51|nr:acyl-CoA dehydrogenase family protein [Reyranella sp.]MBN9088034.1 acyl-CoA dehydrogenase family protein [Reyranella sp.]
MDTRVSAITTSALDRARALQPLLDEHGPEMDRRREVTPEVVDALVKADMLRLLLPRSLGGQEMQLVDYARTIEALGYADASVAWFINQSNVSSSTSAAAMPHDTALEVFGKPNVGLAWGARHSRSKAIRVPGGYRLTGTWSFASGGRHTTWLGAHSAVQNPDGTPLVAHNGVHKGRQDDRSFVFLRSEAKIIDDWQVLGLRGTGSDSYTVEDLFVPDERAPARDQLSERREPGPLYVLGSTLLYATGFCSVTLGVGRRLLESYIELARGKHSRASPSAMAVNQANQREIGLLEAQLSAARAFLHEAAGQAYDAASNGTLTLDHRIRLRLATTYGMNEATDASVTAYRAAGTTAIMNAAPFERRFRDAMSASQHLQAMMPHVEMVGRHLLGVDNPIQHI